MRTRLAARVALLIALAGFVATAAIAAFVLERIPHVQDSVTYLFHAKTYALGRLWVPAPPEPEAFLQEFVVVHEGRWFSKYPPGHALALTPGVLLGAPWLVNPLFAGVALWLVFALGRTLYGPRTGLLAAALVLSSPFFLLMSGSFMAHPTALVWALAFALGWARVWLGPGGGWAALGAGLAWSMLFLTRPWTAVWLAAPFALASVLPAGRALAKRARPAARRWPLIAAAAAFGPLVTLAHQWALTGDPLLNPMVLWWDFDLPGFGPGIGMHGPHSVQRGLENTARNLALLNPHLFGWPFGLSLLFVPLPFLLRRATRADALLLAGFAAHVLGYVGYWADGIMYGPRYYYESLGFLALLSARGVATLHAALAASALRRLPSALLAALVLANVATYLPEQVALHRGYNYVDAGPQRAVERAGLSNALVFIAQRGEPWEWWHYGMLFSANDPLLAGPVVFARDRGPESNRALLARFPGR
ncbi:MAG: glycosyltransferase family 39 protein, partial [Chloroflexi bacterium]|nr:glycosyltransferase family 39 protein [Chloroflexota bacterium]